MIEPVPIGPVVQIFGGGVPFQPVEQLRDFEGAALDIPNLGPVAVGAGDRGAGNADLPGNGGALLNRGEPGAVVRGVAVRTGLRFQGMGTGGLRLGERGPGVGQLRLLQVVDLPPDFREEQAGTEKHNEVDGDVHDRIRGAVPPAFGLQGQSLGQGVSDVLQPLELHGEKRQADEEKDGVEE